jgi:hypothetical protein
MFLQKPRDVKASHKELTQATRLQPSTERYTQAALSDGAK